MVKKWIQVTVSEARDKMHLSSNFLEKEGMDSENIKKQKGKRGNIFMWDLLLEALLSRFILQNKKEGSIHSAFINYIQVSKPIKGGYRKSPNHCLDKESFKNKYIIFNSTKRVNKGLEIVGFKCIFQTESITLIIKTKKKLNLQETSDMVFITSIHGCVTPDEPTQVTTSTHWATQSASQGQV